MDLGVRNRTYIIVGGTRDMGLATARMLAADGARIAIIGRSETDCRRQAEEIANEFGQSAVGLPADAAIPGSLEQAVSDVIAQLGPVRGLITTPGTTAHNGNLLDMSEADWHAGWNSVLMSQVRSCKAVLPHFLEQGAGNIVTTGAYSVRSPKSFLFGYAAYKAAVVNLTKNIAKTYGSQGIRANCVAPGATETGALKARRAVMAEEHNVPVETALEHVMFDVWKMPIAMQRVGQPEEVADLMAFLVSERAAYLTGAVINMDGGTDF